MKLQKFHVFLFFCFFFSESSIKMDPIFFTPTNGISTATLPSESKLATYMVCNTWIDFFYWHIYFFPPNFNDYTHFYLLTCIYKEKKNHVPMKIISFNIQIITLYSKRLYIIKKMAEKKTHSLTFTLIVIIDYCFHFISLVCKNHLIIYYFFVFFSISLMCSASVSAHHQFQFWFLWWQF